MASDRAARALGPLLAIFGAAQLALGVTMWLLPGTFFAEVGPYGTRNDHYLGDLATFYLALGVAALVAARRPGWRVPVIAVAFVQYALHTVNHAIDVGDADPSWLGPANLVSIGLTTVLLGWMFKAARA
jgi:hypothetical protein